MQSGEIAIEYLADHVHWLPIVAEWHFSEWSHLRPNERIQEWIERLKGVCGHRELPTMFVAILDGEPVGSAMLVRHSMSTHRDLFPWVGGVYVIPRLRQKGIGALLVDRAKREAWILGFERAYLYTIDRPEFYAKRGWTTMTCETYREQSVTVMTCESEPNQALQTTPMARSVYEKTIEFGCPQRGV